MDPAPELEPIDEPEQSPGPTPQLEPLANRVPNTMAAPPTAETNSALEPSRSALPDSEATAQPTKPPCVGLPFDVEITDEELADLKSPEGLVSRLGKSDAEFRRTVRVRKLSPPRSTGEKHVLVLPRAQIHKLGTLPPQTPADHTLVSELRKRGLLNKATNSDDVPF